MIKPDPILIVGESGRNLKVELQKHIEKEKEEDEDKYESFRFDWI